MRASLRFAVAYACWAASASTAGPLEDLVMPGAVSEPHAELEGDCAKCHAPLRPAAQRGLCLDCHKEVASDVRAKTGFHGRAPQVSGSQCSSCHGEHKGRTADIVGLVRETFDHKTTDFALRGAHEQTACSACHVAKKPYWEAKSKCIDCHRDDDRHGGAMGTKCADCHLEASWRNAKFDHAKTRFPLKDAHAKVLCVQCHAGERYKDTPRDCIGCHRVDDSHRGTFGVKCESCHATAGWKKIRFDHARDTRFALTGSHASLGCVACHIGGVDAAKKPAMDCVSCHRGDDDHRGRNGAKCADCHGTSAWKPANFDHAKTKFPLRGKHATVACAACHTEDVHTLKLESDCVSCHRSDDPHAGKQGEQCQRCHAEVGWRQKVRFDHDLTQFPLLGMHATVACEECHASRVYQESDTKCVACHAARDAHDKSLGPVCSSCHNPAGWTAWRFDHDTQSTFALHGAHESAPCSACHNTPSNGKIELRQDCASCHSIDDAHNGRFGSDCGRCHVEASWKEVRIR